ncbi:MAG: tetratricopeptide repeat protein [Polyangiaceae bacterium]|nr:tetratricopeptide repeat protein [Polyangiaceae bacterium]
MASQATVVRPTSVSLSVASLVPLAVCVGVTSILHPGMDGVVWGCIVFLSYRILVVRLLLLRHHRRGITLTRAGDFVRAIAAFEQSEAFFAAHPTIDRLRAPLLGSAVRHSFSALAIYNQAYCYARVGDGARARRLLDKALTLDPQMVIARELRDVLEAGALSAREVRA